MPPAPKLPFQNEPATQRKQSSPNDLASGSIDEIDHDVVMAVIRDAFSDGQMRDRDAAIRDVATALGYARVGKNIHEVLDDDLRTAVRRGILESSPKGLSLLCRNITEYKRDFLIEQLTAGMGTTWWEREELIYGTARWLGYRRTGATIRDTLKSAINGAIRRGLLEYEGTRVRRA